MLRLPQECSVKVALSIALLLPALASFAGQDVVSGAVTYIAAGSVYTSLGRDQGIQDSSIIYVVEGADTLARLQVQAISSKSTACRIVTSHGNIKVGSRVISFVEHQEPAAAVASIPRVDSVIVQSAPEAPHKVEESLSPVELKGRVSAQYFTNLYTNSTFNTYQPGMVLNLRGKVRETPLAFEMYANLRWLSSGLSSKAVNQSRIYRLAVSYDDGDNAIIFGRQFPVIVSAIGSIDGLSVARRTGTVTLGAAVGFQPDFSQREVSTTYKKIAVFGSIALPEPLAGLMSVAYGRTLYQTRLDREVVGANVSMFPGGSWSAFANAEMDLRRKRGGDFILSPSLSSVYASFNYRFARWFSAGLGGDASRPVYSFAAIRNVADSLLERRLRGGVAISVQLTLPGNVGLYNTFTPRAGTRPFGKEYSEYTTLSLPDIGGSGVSVRSNFSLNETEFSNSRGYGVHLQKHWVDLFDLTLRMQTSSHNVRRSGTQNRTTSIGADLVVPLKKMLVFFATFDRQEGYGVKSNSVFSELSVRF